MHSSSSRFPRPAGWYDRLVTRDENWEDCEGLPLAIGSFTNEQRIREQIAGALRLLGKYAPVDLARLRRLIRGIVVTQLYGAHAEWRKSLDVCIISTDYLERDDTSPASIAATITHELMHARLDSFGFAYGESQRPRVERICFRASRRFLERLPESTERDAAILVIEEYLTLDDSFWSDEAFRATNASQPWYIRAMRLLSRLLRWHRHT